MADFALVAAFAPWALICRNGEFAVLTILRNQRTFRETAQQTEQCAGFVRFREKI
jgi:hypothetical protein